jgi:hypothetical protein
MNLQTSIRRTIVPMIMGWVASLPISAVVDLGQVEAALVVVLGAAYYGVLRLLEERGVDAAGWWIAFGRTRPLITMWILVCWLMCRCRSGPERTRRELCCLAGCWSVFVWSCAGCSGSARLHAATLF